ncbi:hypothetical protein VTN77DRAFT_8186 [Rasamsonia byssochlamydoides]|uniref:uncharacterized protein n=1 Tax=Rasamsonia byssochlamydoides TaxID=89139 RepID=UPI00374418D6
MLRGSPALPATTTLTSVVVGDETSAIMTPHLEEPIVINCPRLKSQRGQDTVSLHDRPTASVERSSLRLRCAQ